MDPTLAIFRIEDIKNDGLQTAANIALLVLGVLYLALIFWTFADARRRIDDPLLIVCATLAAFFPFIGTIVYVIVRPPEFLDDVRLRELEMTAAEARLASLDYSLCPHCDYEVQSDYLRCPSCMRKLKERCYSCSKPIDPAWRICPFCEAETSAPTPSSHAPPPAPDDGPVHGRRRGGQAGELTEPEAETRRDRRDVAPQTTLTHCSPWKRH